MKPILNILILFSSMHLYAHGKPGPMAVPKKDSLLPVRNDYFSALSYNPAEEISSDLLAAETDYMTTRDNRRALLRLLKIAMRKRTMRDARSRTRLFNDLAGVSAKLKLYPLAMKCYSRAVQYNDSIRVRLGEADSAGLVDSVSYAMLISSDTSSRWSNRPPSRSPSSLAGHSYREIKSMPEKGPQIWEPFDDGKTAVSYALIVQAKQPIAGKRKSFTHINNVGHLFITLIKYNEDNSTVSRSFGFYPHKRNIFSATPLHVKSDSYFKNDSLHEWDEAVGKFISCKRFQKIIELLKKYDHLTYNLNRNNCTDFGLSIASIGGISIMQTQGTWPLGGKGNNPANAGQSMLEGRFRNIDPDYQRPLFFSSYVPSGKVEVTNVLDNKNE